MSKKTDRKPEKQEDTRDSGMEKRGGYNPPPSDIQALEPEYTPPPPKKSDKKKD